MLMSAPREIRRNGILSPVLAHGFPWAHPRTGARAFGYFDGNAECWLVLNAERLPGALMICALSFTGHSDRSALERPRRCRKVPGSGRHVGQCGGERLDAHFLLPRHDERGMRNIATAFFWDRSRCASCKRRDRRDFCS